MEKGGDASFRLGRIAVESKSCSDGHLADEYAATWLRCTVARYVSLQQNAAMNRTDMWRRIEAHPKAWDMIVVGGGATGVGVAIDAATRGYDVLLA